MTLSIAPLHAAPPSADRGERPAAPRQAPTARTQAPCPAPAARATKPKQTAKSEGNATASRAGGYGDAYRAATDLRQEVGQVARVLGCDESVDGGFGARETCDAIDGDDAKDGKPEDEAKPGLSPGP